MIKSVRGKIAISTDWHFGLKNNSVSRLNVCEKMIKEHVDAFKSENVKALFMAGDLFHERAAVNVNTLNVALKCVKDLAEICEIFLICGNHDCFLKNSTDINSLNMFEGLKNVTIIRKPEAITVNGEKWLMVPWLSDLTSFENETFDVAVGHFEISSKYLIKSYVEEHEKNRKVSSAAEKRLNEDALLSSAETVSSGESVGGFVDVVKKNGTIWAGHIHKRKDFFSKGRRFVFVGSPYQQTMGEENCECGFYVVDEKGEDSFFEIKSAPKHVKIKASDVKNGKFDFSAVTGNIIQKIYDVELTQSEEAEFGRKTTEFGPYEELLPEYDVKLAGYSADENESLELIKKSKLEYLRNYVSGIDERALEEQKIDRSKLMSVLERYFAAAENS